MSDTSTTHAPLGAFSLSLSVNNLNASRDFYEKLGFTETGGDAAQGWLILRNGDTVLGLFEGMFDRNMLTFNPGWNQQGDNTATYTDVRDLQAQFEARGLSLTSKADPGSSGPASCMLIDPDGNPILIDQHRS